MTSTPSFKALFQLDLRMWARRPRQHVRENGGDARDGTYPPKDFRFYVAEALQLNIGALSSLIWVTLEHWNLETPLSSYLGYKYRF